MMNADDERFVRAYNANFPKAALSRPATAFQEGQDAHMGKESPTNPYRAAMRSLTDPESLERLSKLATQWEDGYVSVNR